MTVARLQEEIRIPHLGSRGELLPGGVLTDGSELPCLNTKCNISTEHSLSKR